MKDEVLEVLQKYKKELVKERKRASSEFFACKRDWKKAYGRTNWALKEYSEYPECIKIKEAFNERHKISKRLLLVNALLDSFKEEKNERKTNKRSTK